jgi:hypothetical protein
MFRRFSVFIKEFKLDTKVMCAGLFRLPNVRICRLLHQEIAAQASPETFATFFLGVTSDFTRNPRRKAGIEEDNT